MVCAKCQRLQKATELATPGVKRKNDLYYGSPLSTSTRDTKTKTSSATLGNTGVTKNKLLSKAAKNPYASYSSSCGTCKTKTEQGKALCHRCAYKANACAVCGKSQSQSQNQGKKGNSAVPVIEGQKFSAK